MVLQIQLGFESPVIAASLTLFLTHLTGTISPLHRPAICCGLFRHPYREESAPYRRISCGDGTWSTRGRPFSSTENLEAMMRKGSGLTSFDRISTWLARAAGSLSGRCGPGTRGRESFYHHRSNAYLKAGYQATPFNISLIQCGGRSWPRPQRRICASGRALQNGIDDGMARVDLRGQSGQPFPISSLAPLSPGPRRGGG